MPLNKSIATPEQRESAVRHWETIVRPQMAAKEQRKTQESLEAALSRLKDEGWGDIQISEAIRATLPNVRKAAA